SCRGRRIRYRPAELSRSLPSNVRLRRGLLAMINLSRVQRERIVLVVLIAAGLSVFLWQYRASQKKTLALREQALRDARQTVESGRRQCALTNKFETEFESASAKVRQAESRMASGDVY